MWRKIKPQLKSNLKLINFLSTLYIYIYLYLCVCVWWWWWWFGLGSKVEKNKIFSSLHKTTLMIFFFFFFLRTIQFSNLRKTYGLDWVGQPCIIYLKNPLPEINFSRRSEWYMWESGHEPKPKTFAWGRKTKKSPLQ